MRFKPDKEGHHQCQHTTNYANTFIEVAEDSYAEHGTEPPLREQKSAARLQYEWLSERPYTLTSDDLLFTLYALKNSTTRREQQPLEREAVFLQRATLHARLGFTQEVRLGNPL